MGYGTDVEVRFGVENKGCFVQCFVDVSVFYGEGPSGYKFGKAG
jgi:hypothetical protein